MRMIPDEETVETLMEMGGEDKSLFNMCYQCGTCTGTCPWGLVKSFVVRKIMHKAQLGLIDFDDEEIWTCATCGACVTICPRGVEIIDVMRSFRNVVAELGVAKVPDSLRLSVKNIQGVGNPQGEPTDKRGKWADEAGIKAFTPDTEYLYFSCCVPALDSKILRMAISTTELMKEAGVDFGVIGNEESGDIFCGVVGFEISSLIGNESIAHTVRLVESIAGKRLDKGKNLTGNFSGESVLLGAGYEVTPLLFHNFSNLFAHCLAEDISLPQTVTSEGLYNK